MPERKTKQKTKILLYLHTMLVCKGEHNSEFVKSFSTPSLAHTCTTKEATYKLDRLEQATA